MVRICANIVLLYVFWKLIVTIFVVLMNSFNVYCGLLNLYTETQFLSAGNFSVLVINFFGVFFAVGAVYTLAVNSHHAMAGRGVETPQCETKVLSYLII